MTNDFIASVCHEVNRRYCQYIGDNSQPVWEDAPAWQKQSAVNGVTAFLANPAMTPEQSHEGWLAEKRAEGWVYGPVKDPDKKQHPCMVEYAELPPNQRVKDSLFIGTIRMLLASEGVTV